MIPKSQMYLGARIVENDPEEETPVVRKHSINSPFHSKNVILLL